jgi:hypothetical protein
MHSPIRFKKETLEHNIKNVFIYQPNYEKSIIKKNITIDRCFKLDLIPR